MSGVLNHKPSRIIQALLIQIGQASDPDDDPIGTWPAYEGREPDVPDDCITVRTTIGRDFGSAMIDGHRFEDHGFQVRVRSADDEEGYLKARQIAVAIDTGTTMVHVMLPATVAVLTPTTYLVWKARRTGDVLPIGPEKLGTRRELFTINGLLTVRLVS